MGPSTRDGDLTFVIEISYIVLPRSRVPQACWCCWRVSWVGTAVASSLQWWCRPPPPWRGPSPTCTSSTRPTPHSNPPLHQVCRYWNDTDGKGLTVRHAHRDWHRPQDRCKYLLSAPTVSSKWVASYTTPALSVPLCVLQARRTCTSCTCSSTCPPPPLPPPPILPRYVSWPLHAPLLGPASRFLICIEEARVQLAYDGQSAATPESIACVYEQSSAPPESMTSPRFLPVLCLAGAGILSSRWHPGVQHRRPQGEARGAGRSGVRQGVQWRRPGESGPGGGPARCHVLLQPRGGQQGRQGEPSHPYTHKKHHSSQKGSTNKDVERPRWIRGICIPTFCDGHQLRHANVPHPHPHPPSLCCMVSHARLPSLPPSCVAMQGFEVKQALSCVGGGSVLWATVDGPSGRTSLSVYDLRNQFVALHALLPNNHKVPCTQNSLVGVKVGQTERFGGLGMFGLPRSLQCA